MTIYNKTTLRNRFIKKQAEQAFAFGYIEKDLLNKIKDSHPVDLYSPNIILSAGLGLLTALILLASTGICMLLFNIGFNSTFFLIAGIVCYIYLEIVTGSKKNFNSGVDKVMMAASAIFIISGLSIMFHTSKPDTWISLVLFLLCSWFAVRYVDMVAGCVAAFSLLVFSFNAYSYLGQFTIFTFPFLLIAVSACIYYVSNHQTICSDYFIYYPVFKGIKILALCTFYLSGNYYVVNDIIQQNYLLNAQSALSIAPWFFWGWTFAIPAIYVANGIKSRDITFLRLGILF